MSAEIERIEASLPRRWGQIMLCCIAEIAMTIWGIVTLARGEFSYSKSKVVRGAPAYIIGILLMLTLPVPMGIGFVVGFLHVMNTGQQPTMEELAQYSFIDIIAVGLIVAVVIAIASAAGQDKSELDGPTQFQPQKPSLPPEYPPSDPNNPYQPPRSDT